VPSARRAVGDQAARGPREPGEVVEPARVARDVDEGTKGCGWLLKSRVTHVEELRDGVRRVARGEALIDPDVVSHLLLERTRRHSMEDLSDREREVLHLMAEGRSNQAISERLHMAPKTVEGHVASIFMKLGLEPAADDHRRVLAVVAYLREN